MWNSIKINGQNIEKQTANAVLINMPKNSSYSGFKFWHPVKCVRTVGGKGYFVSFSYTNDWKFKLIKNGKGKWNKFDVIDEMELTPTEMEDAFGVVNESITESMERSEETNIIVIEPKKKSVEVKIDENLKK